MRVLIKDRKKLDQLLGAALLNPQICHRLIYERDQRLFEEYELAPETQVWLRNLKVCSLIELAEAVTVSTRPSS